MEWSVGVTVPQYRDLLYPPRCWRSISSAVLGGYRGRPCVPNTLRSDPKGRGESSLQENDIADPILRLFLEYNILLFYPAGRTIALEDEDLNIGEIRLQHDAIFAEIANFRHENNNIVDTLMQLNANFIWDSLVLTREAREPGSNVEVYQSMSEIIQRYQETTDDVTPQWISGWPTFQTFMNAIGALWLGILIGIEIGRRLHAYYYDDFF
uniref:Succinate/fumarate mitochondrial transporter n=1 Tax=Lygus hesperus TaxID=30085 RepID=A0A0A9WID9_LYGHE